MASVHDAVTIERGYFDTLLRRANFNTGGIPSQSYDSQEAAKVSLSQDEYLNLVTVARQYATLRRNLVLGGVGEDMLDLLSQEDGARQASNQGQGPTKPDVTEAGRHHRTSSTGLLGPRLANGAWQSAFSKGDAGRNRDSEDWNGPHRQSHGNETEDEDGGEDGRGDIACPTGTNGHNYAVQPPPGPQYDRQCTRTILLSNLADGTTHSDITSAVRGGLLLDIYIRSNERSATVSFLHAMDARSFFNHVRRHDLYIKNKRVDVKWNDRQFTLSGHVAGKLRIGATRNLVLNRCDSRHTEEGIREDLDHIHNLVVLKIEFINGSCRISTNSVHNALFARNCMMSRQKYKNVKIEWYPDECAQPFDPVPQVKPQPRPAPIKNTSSSTANRFHIFNEESDDDEDEDEISKAFQSKARVDGTA